MKHHWKVYHPHEFQGLGVSYHQMSESINFHDPCQFCGRTFPHKTHECTVVQNLAMLTLMPPKKRRRTQDGAEEAPAVAQPASSTSGSGLSTTVRVFDILRDQGPGFQCTHCMTSFPVSSALASYRTRTLSGIRS